MSDDNELQVTFIDTDDDEVHSLEKRGNYALNDIDDPTYDFILLPDDIPEEMVGVEYDDLVDWELVISVDDTTASGRIVECEVGPGGGARMTVDQRL